jgi:hypothetical protein
MNTWETWELLYWVTVAFSAGGCFSLIVVLIFEKCLDKQASKVAHAVPFSQGTLDAISASEAAPARLGAAIKTYSLNSNRNAAVSNFIYWETDMTICPRGAKVLMLGVSGVAILGQYNGDKFFVGWYPLPRKRV